MPDGVTFSLQVCEYSIEPSEPNRAFNLFTKHRVRAADADEAGEVWPQVPIVRDALLAAGAGEWLAGATAGPDGSIVWPSSQSKSEGPAQYSAEEVALDELLHFFRLHFCD